MAIDYDPIKAHEYYEKHKKLQGRRRSTKGWSQTKKEQWAYAKDQLAQEHKAINKGITESSKERRKQLSEDTKSAIARLRERLKNMPKEEKAEWRDRIRGMCDDLRGKLRQDKEQLSEMTKGAREQEKNAYEVRKDIAYATIKGFGGGSKKKSKKKK